MAIAKPKDNRPLYERFKSEFYRPGAQIDAGSMDQVDESFWQPRIRAAKERDNHILATRLQAERKEFLAAAEELQLSPDQARRLAVVIRDTAANPRKAERLSEREELHLQQRHGEGVQALISKGYGHFAEVLKSKPALTSAVTQSGAWGHPEVASVAAELAAAPVAIPKPAASAA